MVKQADDNGQTWWLYLNIFGSVLLFAGSIVVIAFSFVWFTEGGECSIEKFILSTLIIVPIIYTILSITEKIVHGSLFVSAAVTAYATYIGYSALAADPSTVCNSTIERARNATTYQIVIGILFIGLSITYIAFKMGLEASGLFNVQQDEEEGDVKKGEQTEEGEEGEEAKLTPEQIENIFFNNFTFHVIMTIASMYVAMLLTRWSSQDYSGDGTRYVSEESFWVQTSSLWLLMILYIWTLCAPVLFPDRDFT
eukprot:CAMPEP_0167755714 /NCGR_PEP_ID=MMETSP0110_2-20121227/8980_1 /TAXON_ID=629695 /ORGANISM="Gymnochlora sp., Strain CCMP2014" /LENGTH=252 /DNA_ID=CAMNT_0007641737 /DNA_START=516 /DNA_END=1277 /DNA_ORIENTATION=+